MLTQREEVYFGGRLVKTMKKVAVGPEIFCNSENTHTKQ